MYSILLSWFYCFNVCGRISMNIKWRSQIFARITTPRQCTNLHVYRSPMSPISSSHSFHDELLVDFYSDKIFKHHFSVYITFLDHLVRHLHRTHSNGGDVIVRNVDDGKCSKAKFINKHSNKFGKIIRVNLFGNNYRGHQSRRIWIDGTEAERKN